MWGKQNTKERVAHRQTENEMDERLPGRGVPDALADVLMRKFPKTEASLPGAKGTSAAHQEFPQRFTCKWRCPLLSTNALPSVKSCGPGQTSIAALFTYQFIPENKSVLYCGNREIVALAMAFPVIETGSGPPPDGQGTGRDKGRMYAEKWVA